MVTDLVGVNTQRLRVLDKFFNLETDDQYLILGLLVSKANGDEVTTPYLMGHIACIYQDMQHMFNIASKEDFDVDPEQLEEDIVTWEREARD